MVGGPDDELEEETVDRAAHGVGVQFAAEPRADDDALARGRDTPSRQKQGKANGPPTEAEIDDEPTALRDEPTALRDEPTALRDEPTHDASDDAPASFRPVEATRRLRADRIDRRALPFKKQGRGRRSEEVVISATPPESVWSREATFDPRDLPSSLAPKKLAELPPPRTAPNRRWILVVVMAASLVIGFLVVAMLVR